MIDQDYNRRRFDEFCDQAATIGREAAIIDNHQSAIAQVLTRMRHLTHRATARGMTHDQQDAIARAAATAFADAWSHLEIKRTGGK
jgi:hypothetical protein